MLVRDELDQTRLPLQVRECDAGSAGAAPATEPPGAVVLRDGTLTDVPAEEVASPGPAPLAVESVTRAYKKLRGCYTAHLCVKRGSVLEGTKEGRIALYTLGARVGGGGQSVIFAAVDARAWPLRVSWRPLCMQACV